jgi:hypothetical protein
MPIVKAVPVNATVLAEYQRIVEPTCRPGSAATTKRHALLVEFQSNLGASQVVNAVNAKLGSRGWVGPTPNVLDGMVTVAWGRLLESQVVGSVSLIDRIGSGAIDAGDWELAVSSVGIGMTPGHCNKQMQPRSNG